MAKPSIQIDLLGQTSVCRDGCSVSLPKKATALLAIVLLNRGKIPRKQLARSLWGNGKRSDASCRQCLMDLSSLLGANVIRSDRKYVWRGDFEGVFVDWINFCSLSRSEKIGDLREACSMATQPLLGDLHPPTKAFNRWLAVERRRMNVKRSECLLRLAARLERAGTFAEAIEASRSALDIDPLNEEGCRILLRSLDGIGKRKEGLRTFADLEVNLEEQLGVAPEEQTKSVADKLRRRTHKPNKACRPFPDCRWLAPSTERASIAVLPFTVCGGPFNKDAHSPGGLTRDIEKRLGGIRSSVSQDSSDLLVVASPWTTATQSDEYDIATVGKMLGVRYVLKGSFRPKCDQGYHFTDSSRLTMVARLYDASRNSQVLSERVEGRYNDYFNLREGLCDTIIGALEPRVQHTLVDAPTFNQARFMEYHGHFRSVSLSTDYEIQNALNLAKEYLGYDPHYALAQAVVSWCYCLQHMLGFRALSKKEIQRGITRAASAVKTLASDADPLWMAGLSFAVLKGDVRHAARLLDRAISINPCCHQSWTARALVDVFSGDYTKALDRINRSLLLNPLGGWSQLHWLAPAIAHFAIGNMKEAASAADKMMLELPSYPLGLFVKALATAHQGRLAEAATCVEALRVQRSLISIQWIKSAFSKPLAQNSALFDRLITYAKEANIPVDPQANCDQFLRRKYREERKLTKQKEARRAVVPTSRDLDLPKHFKLDRMSKKELSELRLSIETLMVEKRKSEKLRSREIQASIAAEIAQHMIEASRNNARAGPKFCNPDNRAETWRGRGRRPRWLTEKLRKRGVRIDDFAI